MTRPLHRDLQDPHARRMVRHLTKADICVGKMLTLDELEHDPQIKARNMIVEVETPEGGKVKQVGIAMKFSETPAQSARSLRRWVSIPTRSSPTSAIPRKTSLSGARTAPSSEVDLSPVLNDRESADVHLRLQPVPIRLGKLTSIVVRHIQSEARASAIKGRVSLDYHREVSSLGIAQAQR